jgi:hypothetical protein
MRQKQNAHDQGRQLGFFRPEFGSERPDGKPVQKQNEKPSRQAAAGGRVSANLKRFRLKNDN